MGETKNLTVNALAGAGSFNFTTLAPVKSEYAEGESVYVKYAIKNNGSAPSGAGIVVIDRDTGTKLQTYVIPEMQPGYTFSTTGSHAYVGKMPNKNWNLSFALTP
jgi:hypothetical protein